MPRPVEREARNELERLVRRILAQLLILDLTWTTLSWILATKTRYAENPKASQRIATQKRMEASETEDSCSKNIAGRPITKANGSVVKTSILRDANLTPHFRHGNFAQGVKKSSRENGNGAPQLGQCNFGTAILLTNKSSAFCYRSEYASISVCNTPAPPSERSHLPVFP